MEWPERKKAYFVGWSQGSKYVERDGRLMNHFKIDAVNHSKTVLIYGPGGFSFAMGLSGYLREKNYYIQLLDETMDKRISEIIPILKMHKDDLSLVHGIMYSRVYREEFLELYDYNIVVCGDRRDQKIEEIADVVIFVCDSQEVGLKPIENMITEYGQEFSVVMVDVPRLSESPRILMYSLSVEMREKMKAFYEIPFSEKIWYASVDTQMNLYFNIDAAGKEYRDIMEKISKDL